MWWTHRVTQFLFSYLCAFSHSSIHVVCIYSRLVLFIWMSKSNLEINVKHIERSRNIWYSPEYIIFMLNRISITSIRANLVHSLISINYKSIYINNFISMRGKRIIPLFAVVSGMSNKKRLLRSHWQCCCLQINSINFWLNSNIRKLTSATMWGKS